MLYAYLLLRSTTPPPTAVIVIVFIILFIVIAHTFWSHNNKRRKWDVFMNALHSGELERVKAVMKEYDFGVEISEYGFFNEGKKHPNTSLSPCTPLSIAVANRHHAIAKWLLQEGAYTANRDKVGNTPLLRAVINRDQAMVELLLNYHAREGYNKLGQNALFIAINEKHQEWTDKMEWVAWMDWLLAQGFSVDTTNAEGLPLLMAAIQQSQWQAVDYLLQKGADINIKDEHGRTPLLHAIWSGNFSLADKFLHLGADVNACDNNGYSPLMYALAEGDAASLRLTQELLRKGADLHHTNRHNQNALAIATEKNNAEGIQLLIQAGAKLNKDTAAVLLRAATTGNKDMVALLLDAGADKDINAQDDKGWTPLMHAAYGNHADTVELLMQRGADKDIKNKKGKTVVHIIQEAKHFELFDLMRKYI